MSKKSDIAKVYAIIAAAMSAYVLYDSFERTYLKRQKERLLRLQKQKSQAKG